MPSTQELYLVILYDHSTSLPAAQIPFQDFQKLSIDFVDDVALLLPLIRQRVPNAFVIYKRPEDDEVMTRVKYLRSLLHIDEVPIMVLDANPSREDVENLLSVLTTNS
ncbi:hypothetical protein [Pseudochryseolinea flava]|uniref:Uncharacterized protein n=1 Tax=Pseudochryseolinea flava TaxID=2059302 RepID=A0A364XWU1_9BACT|nr:hypothetical protein [Pseudochryseolinea flava]RAV98696.1 hypothetical protein DQQ10_22020 [Pseudochryseolinea flava]